MLRRWIIRGLALALLALCVTAWVGSYWRWACIYYEGPGFWCAFEVGCGELLIARYDDPFYDTTLSWDWDFEPNPFDRMDRNGYERSKYRLAGFAYDLYSQFPPGYVNRKMFIPVYFPALLSALLLGLVWRKTRPKYNGKGFPVEPAAQPPKP